MSDFLTRCQRRFCLARTRSVSSGVATSKYLDIVALRFHQHLGCALLAIVWRRVFANKSREKKKRMPPLGTAFLISSPGLGRQAASVCCPHQNDPLASLAPIAVPGSRSALWRHPYRSWPFDWPGSTDSMQCPVTPFDQQVIEDSSLLPPRYRLPGIFEFDLGGGGIFGTSF